MLVRSLVFYLKDPLPNDAKFLMEDFRLAVNNVIRLGVHSNVTSKFALSKLAYKDFRKEHLSMYSQHLVSVFEVAGSILKNHRRRLRRGFPAQIPFVRKLFMKAVNQAYKLDRINGILDLPIRAGCHIKLRLVMSEYHRDYLDNESYSLGSMTLLPDRVIVAIRKRPPKTYVPDSIISLDTNERSLDGVLAKEDRITAVVRAEFPEVSLIQSVHHDRRRRLQKKKSHDRRTAKRLCAREGMREHHRIDHRMHEVANAVLSFAEERRSMIVLEDLTGIRPRKYQGAQPSD